MTRQEIETQLRADNPTSIIDGVEYGQGETEYEALLTQWVDAMDAQSATHARETARAALHASWAAQPSWIRGPFDNHFRGAQTFLDAGDDDAAADLIRYAEAPGAYTTEQLATFVTLKTTIADAIAALPPKS